MMPSPLPEHPGLLIRDPLRYTDATVVVPPQLVPLLVFFDGQRTVTDVQTHLTRRSGGKLVMSDVVRKLAEALEQGGFLDTERFRELRAQREGSFRAAPERAAAHAGTAYPLERPALEGRLATWLDDGAAAGPQAAGGPGGGGRLVGIAAPHVSPHGGVASYAAAYRELGPTHAERTVVVLGTSHYGPAERFGLTRKPFATPLGSVQVDTEIVDELARRAPDAVVEEDYCHAVEHSIEFQVVFLQQVLGSGFRVVPILVGAFADSLGHGRPPESIESTRRFFDALADVTARRGDELLWVLGIDLAHIGRRYGDAAPAIVGQGRMVEVAERDRQRLARAEALETAGFFELVHPGADSLRWCGYSPLYTFLAVMRAARPRLRGRLLRYDQWNIDAQSVVSFAAMSFRDPA